MRRRLYIRAARFALLGALFLTLAAPAGADVEIPARWEHVVLETWDGWSYYDITVEPTPDGFLLITRNDGSQRVMAYEEVRALTSPEGTDLTAAVIPDDAPVYAPPSPPAFAGPRTPAAAPPELGRWQPRFRLALSGAAGYGVSLGDWFSGLEAGFCYGSEVRVAVAPALYLAAMVRNQDLDVSGFMPNYPGGYQVFSGTGTVRQFGLGLGAMLPRGRYRDVVPYVECLLAAASHDLAYDERGDIGDYVETLNNNQVAGVVQFGTLVPFSRTFALDAQASWLVTGAADWASGSVLSLSLGVAVMLADPPAE